MGEGRGLYLRQDVGLRSSSVSFVQSEGTIDSHSQGENKLIGWAYGYKAYESIKPLPRVFRSSIVPRTQKIFPEYEYGKEQATW